MNLLGSTFYGNPVQRWIIAGVVAAVTYLVLRIVVTVGARRLRHLAERTTTAWDDVAIHVIGRTKFLFLLVLSIYVGALLLTLPQRLRSGITVTLVVVALLQSGVWVNAAISHWLDRYRKEKLPTDAGRTTTMAALAFIFRLAAWTTVGLLALENLGVNITALIAGLGVGGIAVALAAQKILGDLFASLSIMLDKPFVLGDFLAVGEFLGRVEQIGLKTTRIRSLSGEQIVVSNADLLNSRIRNYGRMYERRVLFTLGVVYQTPREKLLRIPKIIREVIEAQRQTRFDRSHFKTYGAYSLDFETVFYVLVPDYNVYMDIQQEINFRIHERFEEEGIEFAYPSQTLFVVKQESP